MSGSVTPYVNLITSEYKNSPNFLAVVSALCQGSADQQQALASMPGLFDINVAVGSQLDTVGLWIGLSRDLSVPLTGVYFALDTAGVGLDQGTWYTPPFDPFTQLDALPDSLYRQLLYAKIVNNQWDGTVPGAYAFMAAVFPGDTFFIQDNGNMTMYIGVIGAVPLNAVTTALLENGYFNIKPVGVGIAGYVTPSILGSPVFGLDANGMAMAGLDAGCWAVITAANNLF